MVRKKLIIGAVAIVLLLGSLYVLQRLLMPKYVSGIVEGSLIGEYYKEDRKDFDVVFLGDCEVYENFSPVTLWEKYGITSYIRGSAQQLIWQSYYLLEETLKYEKPKVVVFNVLAMQYNQPQKEEYNRMTLDGMELSAIKLKSIQASMMKSEHLVDYLAPLLRFHSRWDQLNEDDFTNLFSKEKLFHNGYYMRVDVKPAGRVPRAPRLPDYRFGSNAYSYLDRLRELCKENGIQLVLVKAPTIYPHWYDEWDTQMEQYAATHDLTYINFLRHMDDAGIDLKTDTYDAGLHLNVYGAEKLATYFGAFLTDTYRLQDHRTDETWSGIWQKKIDFYDRMKQDQLDELAKYGYLKRYKAET
ncbi:SGNH/GDSL hydrolase family protein [Paenibacillus glycanilyticus]|uniref:SGNH/GDSL hydrolase family protein n=1 Tax=Paenibacillus glycanilyticus TaxID=126569 RepID=UPI0020404D8C|nr:SGNH/GDSL hydrolase family protein [Paenibacillus glycanilyticus]MCM3628167.1 SGNH/GDSL hydrolase family protein [Paenibacillus glycanilyticus]